MGHSVQERKDANDPTLVLYTRVSMFGADVIRRQFPALKDGLVYLDSASTTQKPEVVLSAMDEMYRNGIANPNRGVYPLAASVTERYEHARSVIATFVNAKSHEIICTKSTTESINLVARSFGETLRKGDRIALTIMEHHSNIVPWQQLRERKGIELDWVSIDEDGQPTMDELEKILEKGKTKLVAITGLSNVLGSAPDLKGVTEIAHAHGAKVLVDAAQMAAHMSIDVQELDCDFLAFSGHKLYGPMGAGVLFGKEGLLDRMPPFLGGGDMIRSVTKDGYSPADLPRKFEAGTASVVDVIGMTAAIEWLSAIAYKEREAHEHKLMEHALKKLQSIENVRILGTTDPQKRKGCISFAVEGVHPHDLTEVLGQNNICLRAGHHCTQPLHEYLGINASARLSIGIYNTKEDIDRCITVMTEAVRQLKK